MNKIVLDLIDMFDLLIRQLHKLDKMAAQNEESETTTKNTVSEPKQIQDKKVISIDLSDLEDNEEQLHPVQKKFKCTEDSEDLDPAEFSNKKSSPETTEQLPVRSIQLNKLPVLDTIKETKQPVVIPEKNNYQCPQCERQFSDYLCLKSHIKTVHFY